MPLIVSFLLFIALCASAAYWAMQLFKPPVRPVAAPPRVVQAEIRPYAAATLFGSRKDATATASNYQLRGVIFSGNPRDSIAIISADGKPPQAIRVDTEVVPGVTIKEVHRDYILLSEGGATKRVDLPESTKGLEGIAAVPPVPRTPIPLPTAPTPPIPTRAQAAAAAQQQQATQAVPGLPAGQPVPQMQPPGTPNVPLTPQNAPSPPLQGGTQAQPVPGQMPAPATITTAPPTTVVNPAGAPVMPPTAPATAVPGTQPMPGAPTAPAR
ncbi:MAG TPA: type II secretion system protein N [Noviherbaspirillum sp.]|nr:type II secretion system protein N [Noviherbaspirillum sp.]